MATGATVKERIIELVATKLSGITVANGFNREFAKIARQDRNIQNHPQTPLAIIVDAGTVKDDQRNAMKMALLTLMVIVAISANENDSHWAKNLDLYVSDVETALSLTRDDFQLGGLAVKVATKSIKVYDSDEIGSSYLVAARLEVEIEYRHLYEDTTTAI